MPNEFITPNWHPLFVHFPIALVIVGVVIEIISFRRSGFRVAGRWMMLLGSLLAIPTALLGIYALYQGVSAGVTGSDLHWRQIVEQSTWSPQQWQTARLHVLLNSVAVGIFLLSTIVYLAGSDAWRRSIRWVLVIAMLVGVGVLGVGAWHGGELVYRFGTGVMVPTAGQVASPAAGGVETGTPGLQFPENVKYYTPPLELHIMLAGFVGAFVVAAFSLMIRRWNLDTAAEVAGSLPPEAQPVTPGLSSPTGPVSHSERVELRLMEAGTQNRAGMVLPAKVYPGWFWLGAFLVAACTAVAGAWTSMDVFTRQAWEEDLRELRDPAHLRLLAHVIVGGSIVVLSIFLAGVVRLAPRLRGVAGFFGVIVLGLLGGQVWLGTLLAYDTTRGPLTGWAAVEPAGASLEPAAAPLPRKPVPSGNGSPGVAPLETRPQEAVPAPQASPPVSRSRISPSPSREIPPPPASAASKPVASSPAQPVPARPEELGNPPQEPSEPHDRVPEGSRHEEVGAPI